MKTWIVKLTFLFGSQLSAQSIKWAKIDEVSSLNESTKKKYFVEVYTDWCVFCKKMNQCTFTNAKLSEFINTNYQPVKFNAEQRENVYWNGYVYTFRNYGRRGYNTLAVQWLRGNMRFPCFLVISADKKHIEKTIIGYKTVRELKKELSK